MTQTEIYPVPPRVSVAFTRPQPELKALDLPSPESSTISRAMPLRTEEQIRGILALRYEVYCRERNYLPESDYPDGLEIDHYDTHSLHFGVEDNNSRMVGCLRLVEPSQIGFPLDDYWPDSLSAELRAASVEVSRLIVPRRVGRTEQISKDCARSRYAITSELFAAMLQGGNRLGYHYLLAAMEPRLARLLQLSHLPSSQIGPRVDYHGQVGLYLLDIMECYESLRANCPTLYWRLRQDRFRDSGPADQVRSLQSRVLASAGLRPPN